MLHQGGYEIELEEVNGVLTPKPTETHFPIDHSKFINLVRKTAEKIGLSIKREVYGLSDYKDKQSQIITPGSEMFGIVEVEKEGGNNGVYSNIFGIRNSHNKKFSAGLVAGACVFVCDNMAFTGEAELKIGHKHTKNIWKKLPNRINQLMHKLMEKWEMNKYRYDAYALKELSSEQAHDLIVQMHDADALPGSHIPRILGEYREPKHEAFEGRNVWSLFNAGTEVAKSAPSQITNRTEAITTVCDAYCREEIDSLLKEADQQQLALTE
tara:strand:- start:577 stop:1380 length:804 start_codon:yes stop_codon:yes gene_type:complete